MIGYIDADRAYQAAKKYRVFGCTGSGQQCCPVDLPDGSVGYWTAHSYFRPSDDAGTILVRGGKEIDPQSQEAVDLFGSTWLINDLGVHGDLIDADYYGVEDLSR